ncbi:MAG: universal stress protein [Myxococcales bacterium]|nr:universal stress protein [Myxococcales bacterium]
MLQLSSEVGEFEPAAALLGAAERHNADLIVVGTHGRIGLERLTLARTAEYVGRKSPCSVLVARAVQRDVAYMSRILVPTDSSEPADEVLTAACLLAAGDSRIDVVHYWMHPFYAIGSEGLAVRTASLDRRVQRMTEDGEF